MAVQTTNLTIPVEGVYAFPLTVVQGEERAWRFSFTQGGRPLVLSGAVGATLAYTASRIAYAIEGQVEDADGGVASVRWTAGNATPAGRYDWQFTVASGTAPIATAHGVLIVEEGVLEEGGTAPIWSGATALAVANEAMTLAETAVQEEADPVFSASPAAGLTLEQVGLIGTAIQSESDPVFSASPAAGLTTEQVGLIDSAIQEEVDPLSLHLDQSTPQAMQGDFQLPTVKIGRTDDDGTTAPLQVKGTYQDYPCGDASGGYAMGNYPVVEEVYAPYEFNGVPNFESGIFIDQTLYIDVYAYRTASDATRFYSLALSGTVSDSSGTLFSCDVSWADGGYAEGFIVVVNDGSTTQWIDVGYVTSTNIADFFNGWNGDAPVLTPSSPYVSNITGNLLYDNSWTVWAYKTTDGVTVYSATPTTAYDSDYSDYGYSSTIQWDDVGADGYVVQNDLGYWIDVGNATSVVDDGSQSGWNPGNPDVSATPYTAYGTILSGKNYAGYGMVVEGTGKVTITTEPGVPPLAVSDPAAVENLNADLLDGQHASAFQPAGTYVGSVGATSPILSSGGTAPTISHAATAGNIHLPAAGTSNQILKNSGTAGTGSWATVEESSGALTKVTSITETNASLNAVVEKKAADSELSVTNEILYTTSGTPYRIAKDSNATGANFASALVLGTDFSLGVWVIGGGTGISHLFLGAGGQSNLACLSGVCRFYMLGSPTRSVSFAPITFGAVDRIVFTKSGTTCKCYLNGVELTISTDSNPTINSSVSVTKMFVTGAVSSYDEMVAWDHALTPAEIAADYSGGSGKYYSSADAGVTHVWHFDEGTPGAVMVDSVGDKDATWGGGSQTYPSSTVALPRAIQTASVISSKGGNLAVVNDKGTLTIGDAAVKTTLTGLKVLIPGLPTSDPSVAGQLWNDGGTLKISAG